MSKQFKVLMVATILVVLTAVNAFVIRETDRDIPSPDNGGLSQAIKNDRTVPTPLGIYVEGYYGDYGGCIACDGFTPKMYRGLLVGGAGFYWQILYTSAV